MTSQLYLWFKETTNQQETNEKAYYNSVLPYTLFYVLVMSYGIELVEICTGTNETRLKFQVYVFKLYFKDLLIRNVEI